MLKNSANIKAMLDKMRGERNELNAFIVKLENEHAEAVEVETKTALERGSEAAEEFNQQRDGGRVNALTMKGESL
jgi:hypothetical protein